MVENELKKIRAETAVNLRKNGMPAAADLLERRAAETADVIPMFYVKGRTVFQRPVRTKRGVRMGFAVCDVHDGVDPAEVCGILNKGEPATDGD